MDENIGFATFSSAVKALFLIVGLKKVSDDMKTHKNPALRTGPAPFKPPTAPKPGAAPTKPVAAAVKPKQHPPLVELQGKKWAVVSIGLLITPCHKVSSITL